MTTIEAILDQAMPKYRSKIEEKYANLADVLIQEQLNTDVIETLYEPFTVRLPGAFSYTPDFFHVLEDRRLLIVEVKNSKKQKGYRVTHNKILTAAAMFPYFLWAETFAEKGYVFEMMLDELEK